MNVILSIKPEYCDKIAQGKKSFEFRRRIFKKDVKSVFMYSIAPVQKIVGKFEIKSILHNNPKDLWETCRDKAGITSQEYFDYFDGSERAHAIEIINVQTFEPIDPKDILTDFSPPQSFRYIDSIEL